MGVPKKRQTKSKQGHRRSHISVEKKTLTSCVNCGKTVSPHRVCENCGQYKGRQTIDVLAKLSKRERKEKEKELTNEAEQQTANQDLSMEGLSKRK